MNDSDFGLKNGDLKVIIDVIAGFSEIEKAAIFGSRAKGTYRNGSDVDIAVWSANENLSGQLSGVLNDETLLPYQFDVVNYERTDNQRLKAQIAETGIKIHPKK